MPEGSYCRWKERSPGNNFPEPHPKVKILTASKVSHWTPMTAKMRHIIHLDMDAFYASVETLDNPSLQGKPVIVGGNSSRGVVSAASYEARKFGVHSALPVAIARNRCPGGIFLPPRISRYQEISKQIMAIFREYTPLVEPLSLDEAFLDVSGSQKLFGTPYRIAVEIRKRVREEVDLTVSAGIATSKLLAKIASDFEKPDGLTLVPPGGEKSFLAPLPIKKLWGVGRKTLETLSLLGIETIGDLSKLPISLLEEKMGQKYGQHLHLAANAIDHRLVEPNHQIKSIGHEDTFPIDLLDMREIHQKLLALSVRVGERVREHSLTGRTITIKIKYHDFQQISRSASINNGIDDGLTIYHQGMQLLKKSLAGKKAIRLIGIYLTNLSPSNAPRQGLLFDGEEKIEKCRNLNKAIDTINERFEKKAGYRKIIHGRLLLDKRPPMWQNGNSGER